MIEWVPLDRVLALVAGNELLGSGSLVGLLYLLAQRSKASGSEGEAVDPASLAD